MKPKITPLAAACALLLTACGGSSNAPSTSAHGGSVNLWAEWTSVEQGDFTAALQPFESQNVITINYAG